MIEQTPAIQTKALTKRFKHKTAVEDLSLVVASGTVFGFIGPNGAGKSTTIRMLMGLLPIDSGSATVLGMDVGQDPQAIRRRVGYVPEQNFIYRWMTVGEVIRFCRRLHETWNAEEGGRLLERFELDPHLRVKRLSKGMLAKLSLLLAVAPEPDLLILDEPTSGLDPIIREEFLNTILQSFCCRGKTVLFSSHTLADIQRVADSVGLIHRGRLLMNCTVAELLARTKRVRVALERDELPDDLPSGVIRARRGRHECVLTITDFQPEMLDQLDDPGMAKVVEVADVGLEEIFKDYILGQKEAL